MMEKRYLQYMYSYPHKTAYRSLSGVSLKDYVSLLEGTGHGLYVHIPFCQAKCGYCNLFSVTGQDTEAVERYLEALERQSMQYEELASGVRAEFSQFAAGGGTPLYLNPGQLEQMFETVRNHFRFSKGAEFVIETAPNQTDAARLRILKQQGVTRVSMGIQSFHDRELSALGRHHCAKKAREALELLKMAEFSCVNVDFIYGIPGQTSDSLLTSLREALAYEPDELFLYPLYVSRGAGLLRSGVVPDEKEAFLQYEHARDFLLGRGFRQDSMRRFVRQHSQALADSFRRIGKAEGGLQNARAEGGLHNARAEGGLHNARAEGGLRNAGNNQPYMEREFQDCGSGTSLALGCGGRSYLGNLHFCSPYAVTKAECMQRIREFEQTDDFTEITHGFFLSEEELKRRYVIRHLLIYPGLPLNRYQNLFHSDAAEDFPILNDWTEKGYVRRKAAENGESRADGVFQEEFLALTETGLGLSDCLGPQLISDSVRQAMQEWEEEHSRHLSGRRSGE